MASSLLMANPISIERIVVSATSEDSDYLYMQDTNLSESKNQESFTKKSIKVLSSHANMNPFSVVAFSPSVNFSPVDSAGSNEPSFHDPIRIRGKSQTGPGGVFMLNSMPVSSNPGGGKHMVDLENIASIDLLKGYMPVDKNLGFSSLIGKVDMSILAPSKTTKTTLSQSFGSDSFSRTFLRVDSGKVGDFSAFGSLSFLSSDKNKGSGELEKFNAMLGFSYEPNDQLKADVYVIKNRDKHHNYDSLSYLETKNLKSNYNNDYSSFKKASSNDYYDYNKQDFETTSVLGDLTYKPTSKDTISFKAYYKQDEGDYWWSNAKMSDVVMNWKMDHDLYGAVASYEHEFMKELKVKLGYWYHRQQPPGPPSDQKKYKVTPNSDLKFAGYAVLSKNDYHTLQSPFLEVSGEISKFNYTAGVRYQTFELGSIKSYGNGTTGATSPNYDAAIASGTLDPWASVDARTFHTFLPSLYLGYELSDSSSIYLDYTRAYGFNVNLFPTYSQQRNQFVAKGVTLEQLWDKQDLEISENIDFGSKILVGGVTLNPSIFVSFIKNKQANIYDPYLGVGYPSNVGDALGYGAEFSANGAIRDDLEFLLGLSYNKYSFTQDFKTSTGSTSNIKNNQLPDAPEFMAKAALSYYIGRWAITPSARYTSSRYGDVANTQKVDAFTIVDLDISYKPQEFFGSKDVTFRATITNLTDERYISTIITADNALSTSGDSTYQTGAPLGVFFSANLKY